MGSRAGEAKRIPPHAEKTCTHPVLCKSEHKHIRRDVSRPTFWTLARTATPGLGSGSTEFVGVASAAMVLPEGSSQVTNQGRAALATQHRG